MRTRVLTWLFPARRAPWTLAPAHVGERHTIHPFEGRCECGLRTAPPAMVLP